ncbi:uncharacterized protein LOC142320274 [Lycorma delicatula]|uniref:uncharacterized protein LOC142320274 n=1 Tax=Lycorma delicatula TaxID=130591 RepID=UPI003F50D55F
MDAMSKKEKLARGSAVIKVMRVNPRPGRYLKSYIDPRKIPKAPPKAYQPKGMAAEMPHLDVKNAQFLFDPRSAKIFVDYDPEPGVRDPCDLRGIDEKYGKRGIPDGDRLLRLFGYREWAATINPTRDGNLAEHFNILLGLLISMAEDPENQNFADIEAYPCVQFLRTIKTPDGEVPYNIGSFIAYLEFVAQKMLEEG